MYFGPLKWPRPWVWLAALALTAVILVLAGLGVDPQIPTVIAVIVILAIAAPRRVAALGARGMRDSEPKQ
jgi:Flp pilus assembly protein TadB